MDGNGENMKVKLLKIENGYNFWRLTTGGQIYWNITPLGQGVPEGGYRSQSYIEHIKHGRFDNPVKKTIQNSLIPPAIGATSF